MDNRATRDFTNAWDQALIELHRRSMSFQSRVSR